MAYNVTAIGNRRIAAAARRQRKCCARHLFIINTQRLRVSGAARASRSIALWRCARKRISGVWRRSSKQLIKRSSEKTARAARWRSGMSSKQARGINALTAHRAAWHRAHRRLKNKQSRRHIGKIKYRQKQNGIDNSVVGMKEMAASAKSGVATYETASSAQQSISGDQA